MLYPNEILPNINYKTISTKDVDCFSLIRHVDDETVDTIIDEITGFVKSDFIANPTSNLRDLSTSLYGIYAIEHTKIRIKKDGGQDYLVECLPNSEVVPPLFDVHFDTYENRTFWFIQISNIQNQRAEYINPQNQEILNAECQIEHTPMKWNYWHFSIRWKFSDGRYWHEMSQKEIDKYSRKIGHETKAIISKFAQVVLPKYKTIPTSIYISNPASSLPQH